jgi:hypothetical protein
MRLIRSIIRNEPHNEHIFIPRAIDAVEHGLVGKNAIGVVDRTVARYRRVQMERAYIAQVTRLQNPDLVIFHTPTHDEAMARIAVAALHGTRQRMMTYRYDSHPVQRGTLRRIVLSRISMWVVPTAPAGRVLEAAGIDRERIRVLKPPVRQPLPIPQQKAQAELGIPGGKPVVTVVDPSAAEVALLAPTLQRMESYDQSYTLVIANPSDDVLTTLSPLIKGSGGQAILLQTDARVDDGLQPVDPLLEHRESQLVAASDATLALEWTQSVRRPAIKTMMGERELLVPSTEDSRDATGGMATFIQADTPAQVTSTLSAFSPDPAKALAGATFARQEYDEVQRVADHGRVYADTLPVRARSRGTPAP